MDHSYHNTNYNLMPVIYDHGYCRNGQSSFNDNFYGKHNLPYEEYIQKNMNHSCTVCLRLLFKDKAILKMSDNTVQYFCSTCKSKIDKGETPSIAWANNMDPGNILHEIKQLSKIEQRFIALIHVFMTVFTPTKETTGNKRYYYKYPCFSI